MLQYLQSREGGGYPFPIHIIHRHENSIFTAPPPFASLYVQTVSHFNWFSALPQNIRLFCLKFFFFLILTRLFRKCDKPIQMFTVTPSRLQNFPPKKYMMMGIKKRSFSVDFKNPNMPLWQNSFKKSYSRETSFSLKFPWNSSFSGITSSGAFCHKVKFAFLKSTKNYKFFDVSWLMSRRHNSTSYLITQSNVNIL
jgi:hypothetical protein